MINFCAKTDIGLKRKKNDDFFLVVTDGVSGLDIKRMGRLFAVADGMGGHPAGDVASRIACEGLRDYYYNVSKIQGLFWGGFSKVSCRPLLTHLVKAFKKANEKVCFYGCEHRSCDGLGTTLSVLILARGQAFIGHVGDSRIYRFRQGQLERLTRDHTFVQDLLDYGDITQEEARVNPMRHVLMQSIGQGFEKVDTWCDRLIPGDMFVLCSDGLHDMISDDEICQVFQSGNTVEKSCDMLIKCALNAGGRDNVTVIVTRYEKS